ncbi:MAG: DUF2167 domain-containing protein [Acidobacteriota bacterium]
MNFKLLTPFMISLLILMFVTFSSVVPAKEKPKPAASKSEKPKGKGKDSQKDKSDTMTAEEFEASLKYENGVIKLGDGIATLKVPAQYRFLNGEQSEKVLVDAWGNPPGARTLGMLFPSNVSPLDENSWGVVITFHEEGYIKDDDAADLDYKELMQEMKEDTQTGNAERKKMGYESVELIGWAASPHYDKSTHKLYWAKELKFGEVPENTLNYDVRILGRKGYLSFNAVASMNQLPAIEDSMQDILGLVEFNEGHRYTDFNSGYDKVAAYGIGGLIAGKVLAKVGFFKLILGFLVAGKKFLIFIIIALGALLKKLFTKITGTKEETPEAPTGLNI